MNTKHCLTRDSFSQQEYLSVEEMKSKADAFYKRFQSLQKKVNRYKRNSPKLDALLREMDYAENELRFYQNWASMLSIKN